MAWMFIRVEAAAGLAALVPAMNLICRGVLHCHEISPFFKSRSGTTCDSRFDLRSECALFIFI